MSGYSPVEGGGVQRTHMSCHDCNKDFVAELDLDINGEHVIECPYCGHEHCRTVRDGVVTDNRWEGRNGGNRERVKARSVWKSSVIQAKTSSVSMLIRERWMNRSDFNGRVQ